LNLTLVPKERRELFLGKGKKVWLIPGWLGWEGLERKVLTWNYFLVKGFGWHYLLGP